MHYLMEIFPIKQKNRSKIRIGSEILTLHFLKLFKEFHIFQNLSRCINYISYPTDIINIHTYFLKVNDNV